MCMQLDKAMLLRKMLSRSSYNERGCLVWQGGQNSDGYGLMWLQRGPGGGFAPWLVHRLSWYLAYGTKPRQIVQTCGTKHCWHIDHLAPYAYHSLRTEPEFLAYVLSKTIQQGECLIWQGPMVRGYGVTYIPKELRPIFGQGNWLTHRLVYRLATGMTPEVCCHACDNPACINPAHLFNGTQQENCQNTASKGRTTWGEKNHHAKLTNAQVIEIRKRAGTISQRVLAQEFQVQQQEISRIVRGVVWKRTQNYECETVEIRIHSVNPDGQLNLFKEEEL